MVRGAAWGVGKALNSREAARIAAERALDQMGTARPIAVIALAAQEFDLEEITRSLVPLLPNVPLWGFSTIGVLTADGEQPHSVVVLILSGTRLSSRAFSFTGKNKDSLEIFQQALEASNLTGVLLAADGYGPLPKMVSDLLEKQFLPVCGGLASGLRIKGKTFQLGGDQVQQGGVSALVLGERFRMACGVGSGWNSVGKTYRITKAEELWLAELDGSSPAEVYEYAFGYPARDWAFPPLNELVRLYPLGVESGEEKPLTIHAPLWAEVDGRFRVNLPVMQGETAYLMVGDRQSCLQSASQAARDAVSRLGEAQPIAALVFVDVAWQMLFEDQTDSIISAIREVVPEIPLVGAYTFGQMARIKADDAITLYNQHIEVVLIGTVSK